jgi:hypothetical protein
MNECSSGLQQRCFLDISKMQMNINLPPRLKWIVLWFSIVSLGILSRKVPMAYELLGKYPGDALWAMQLAVVLRIVFPYWVRKPWLSLALTLCVLNEILQGIPWEPLNRISNHPLGHYFLGTDFGWGDLVAYTVGIGILSLWFLFPRKHSPSLET